MVSLRFCFLIGCALVLVACTQKITLEENSYSPSTLLSKEEFLKQVKLAVPDAKDPVFVGYNGEIFLDLGDIHEGAMKDHVDGKLLELYFSYNPQDDFYGIKYHKLGVYGGSYERRTIMYFPQNHTLFRARAGARVGFNETWRFMTFEDIVLWSKTTAVETDCYSYVGN